MSEIKGPCVVCGAANYSLSMGGPSICPSCDCGPPDPRRVREQREALATASMTVLRLTRELAGAVKALRPFAECCRPNDVRGDGVLVSIDSIERHRALVVELGDLRRAHAIVERYNQATSANPPQSHSTS